MSALFGFDLLGSKVNAFCTCVRIFHVRRAGGVRGKSVHVARVCIFRVCFGLIPEKIA